MGAAAAAHLLPGFDELLLGYKDRSASLAPRHAERVVPGANGMFRSTLVLDAQVRGTWSRSARAKTVVLDATPFGRMTTEQKHAFDCPAARFGEFFSAPVAVHWVK
jgi:hypothetical protein